MNQVPSIFKSADGDGALELLPQPQLPARRRSWPFLASVLLHGVAAVILSVWPELDNEGVLRSHEETLEEQLKHAKKTMLYYPRVTRLPDVSPKAARRVTQEAKSIPDPQMIRTSLRRSLNTDQFIKVQVPKIQQQAPLPSPNIVVVQQAAAVPPPPPVIPPSPPARKFVAPSPSKPSPGTSNAGLIAAVENAPPQPTIPLPTSGSNGATAPSIPSNRTFLPPPPVSGKGNKASTVVEAAEAAPKLAAQGTPGGNSNTPTTIVISATPVPGAPPPMPEGNRVARISVGGESGTGNNRAAAPAGGVTAPGVVIRSTLPPAPSTPEGRVGDGAPRQPPSAATGAELPARVAPPNITQSISIPLRPNARQLPALVEAAFLGRVVYSTVVPTAGAQPDWVIWFAEPVAKADVNASVVQRIVMRPPVPERGTLPATIPGMPSKAWLKARVQRNGVLMNVVFLSDGSTPPPAAVISELGKWMFYPAVRNGQQTEVEVIMEVHWRP
jgi:hypothetical protein